MKPIVSATSSVTSVECIVAQLAFEPRGCSQLAYGSAQLLRKLLRSNRSAIMSLSRRAATRFRVQTGDSNGNA